MDACSKPLQLLQYRQSTSARNACSYLEASTCIYTIYDNEFTQIEQNCIVGVTLLPSLGNWPKRAVNMSRIIKLIRICGANRSEAALQDAGLPRHYRKNLCTFANDFDLEMLNAQIQILILYNN
uniref:Uncharacterized protein n=1 Tax=Glossina austeni TaxID=7395 RepID=A0A1A9VYG1_GLOAU